MRDDQGPKVIGTRMFMFIVLVLELKSNFMGIGFLVGCAGCRC